VADTVDNESQEDIGSVSVTNTLQQFKVHTVKEKRVVSDMSSLAQEHAKQAMSTDMVHYSQYFPYSKIIRLESKLDFGGKLQKRICYKLNIRHDP
jgi:anion-transporting  ArsA/GET3 family ATPase